MKRQRAEKVPHTNSLEDKFEIAILILDKSITRDKESHDMIQIKLLEDIIILNYNISLQLKQQR
jgi:hypothetical protein